MADNTADLCIFYTGLILFLLAALAGVFNMFRFGRTHGGYTMGLFYVSSTLCLLARAGYFLNEIVWNNRVALFGLTVLPGYLSCSVAASQSIIYLCLFYKLTVSTKDEFRRKVRISVSIASVFIIGFPLSFVI